MSIHRFTYPDAEAAAGHCAEYMRTVLSDRLSGDAASVAVSGGSTPKLLFAALADAPFPWKNVHFFWVDERPVPPTDQQSNFRLAKETLLDPAHVPQTNIHRIRAELPPEEAAREYEMEIRTFFHLKPGELPHFDLIHRGIGADAHTASLFPGEPLIEDRQGIAAAIEVRKLGQKRITLLPGVLLNARHTVMLVCGADKAEAVRAVFEEPYEPRRYPAQLGVHDGRGVYWFLDHAAAKLMD